MVDNFDKKKLHCQVDIDSTISPSFLRSFLLPLGCSSGFHLSQQCLSRDPSLLDILLNISYHPQFPCLIPWALFLLLCHLFYTYYSWFLMQCSSSFLRHRYTQFDLIHTTFYFQSFLQRNIMWIQQESSHVLRITPHYDSIMECIL